MITLNMEEYGQVFTTSHDNPTVCQYWEVYNQIQSGIALWLMTAYEGSAF